MSALSIVSWCDTSAGLRTWQGRFLPLRSRAPLTSWTESPRRPRGGEAACGRAHGSRTIGSSSPVNAMTDVAQLAGCRTRSRSLERLASFQVVRPVSRVDRQHPGRCAAACPACGRQWHRHQAPTERNRTITIRSMAPQRAESVVALKAVPQMVTETSAGSSANAPHAVRGLSRRIVSPLLLRRRHVPGDSSSLPAYRALT